MSFFASLFKQSQPNIINRPKTILDAVIYVAGLVSDSDAIDPILDGVRGITAKLQPGEAPSKEDAQSLINIYLQIEQYLVTKEAIRTFAKEDLRIRLDPPVLTMITRHEMQR